MDPYIQSLLNQYQSKLAPQKTPQQIAEEQRMQAYQVFITTKEGIDANKELEGKFNNWLDVTYGTKNSDPSKEVSELKNMMETMAKQSLENQNVISSMAKQIETLSNQLK